jgi:4-diphosphocytidyl-2-C-methyl-D-erythritol kinase
MRVRAHAKINLSLRVLGVRADGYHELRTVFQSIALHDTLTIRHARGPFRLSVDDPACPADETNLIWRAAERLWTASGRRGAPRDVAIEVAKRIPMQAGLGGGSSDAAAVLSALGRAWRVDEAIVRETGAAIGADVPYFFEGGTVLGLERGDVLFPLADQPRAFVVLVLPDFGVSTRDAFTWLDHSAASSSNPQILKSSNPQIRRSGTSVTLNDLQPPVVAHHPEIGRIISALRRAGADQAAMSGSGSAVFGLFSARTAAIAAGRRLTSRHWRVLVTRTLTRRQFRALARI